MDDSGIVDLVGPGVDASWAGKGSSYSRQDGSDPMARVPNTPFPRPTAHLNFPRERP
jgi:hypothetical protein